MKSLIILMIILTGCASQDLPRTLSKHVVQLRGADFGGTGFHLKYGGKVFIVTNNHVCDTNSELSTPDGSRKVIAKDIEHDLCILESKRSTGLRISAFNALPMDKVTTMGHPQSDALTIREGRIVSYRVEPITHVRKGVANVIYTSLVAFSGSSGSPVINSRGFVIGVLYAVNISTDSNSFLVPREDLIRFLNKHK